jgi:hypothetical protein
MFCTFAFDVYVFVMKCCCKNKLISLDHKFISALQNVYEIDLCLFFEQSMQAGKEKNGDY